MLCSHHKKREGAHKENFGGVGYVYSFDCGDSITVYSYVQTHQIIYVKHANFVYQLYLNKLLKKIMLLQGTNGLLYPK